jgi:hypothetical protein
MPALLPCTPYSNAVLKGLWGEALKTAVMSAFREQEQNSEAQLQLRMYNRPHSV